MQTIPNVSSEEELLQLREEGKISEAEYQDLLSAMSRSASAPQEQPQLSEAAAKHKRGKTALIIMLVGLALPALGYGTLATLLGGPKIAPWFFLALAFQIVAFALGVSSWRDVYAKATVITISVIAGFILLLYVVHAWRLT